MSTTPFGGRTSSASNVRLSATSKPAVEATDRARGSRPRSSAPRRDAAGRWARSSTSDAVSRRSTSRIAATSASRWCSPSGASNDGRELVAAAVEDLPLPAALRGEPGTPHAAIVHPCPDHDEPVALERAQHSAQVAGVEVEAAAQRPHLSVTLPISHSTRASPSARPGRGRRRSARRPSRSRCD